MSTLQTFLDVLNATDRQATRPASGSPQVEKKNYAERLSRHIATLIAGGLRPKFEGITPDASGKGQESKARTGKGVKKLDVNYSTPELGLGLGVSIKTINFADASSGRYTKNYTRVDNELRAEAMDYHLRQPFAVLVGAVFLPSNACDDAGSNTKVSSFGAAVKIFRHRSDRKGPKDEAELFERLFVALYEYEGATRGEVAFFDVTHAPPKRGRPKDTLTLSQFIKRVVETYDRRNDPPFKWAESADS